MSLSSSSSFTTLARSTCLLLLSVVMPRLLKKTSPTNIQFIDNQNFRSFRFKTVNQKNSYASTFQIHEINLQLACTARIKMNPKNLKILAVGIAILIIALSLTVAFSQSPTSKGADDKLARIACLGDSITNETYYPADLQALLGQNSTVRNFGMDGATVNFDSNRTYYFSDEYLAARDFLPTTVIIILGTNDARTTIYQKSTVCKRL